MLLFIAVVVVQHFLVPALDPLRHQISEYSNARGGGLMIAGFAVWSGSFAALAGLVWLIGGGLGALGRVLVFFLALAAAGGAVTAAFATQTSAGALPSGVSLSSGGRIHDFGSAVLSVSVFAAATASIWSVQGPRWYRSSTILLLVLVVLTSAILLAVGPSVGGLRQRVLVALACSWQLLLLRALNVRYVLRE